MLEGREIESVKEKKKLERESYFDEKSMALKKKQQECRL